MKADVKLLTNGEFTAMALVGTPARWRRRTVGHLAVWRWPTFSAVDGAKLGPETLRQVARILDAEAKRRKAGAQ